MKPKDDFYNLKYPIGEFDYSRDVSRDDITQWIKDIEIFPAKLRNTIRTLSENELDTPYRPGGWRVRQVVHHLGDSHLNGYVRFKLALTENVPTIKPYDQTLWAELQDSEKFPVENSLLFLELLHRRWTILLKSMKPEEFDRKLNHPESGVLSLKVYLGAYAWHGNHHLAHITGASQRSF